MKKILLYTLLLLAGSSFGQVVEQFNYLDSLTNHNWVKHSGAVKQFKTSAGSLSYAGLAASVGNKADFKAGETEDVNLSLGSTITGTGYYSFLLNLPNTTGLTTLGDYFTGFGATTGASVTIFAPRVFIKTGTVAGTFQLGIQNTTGGSPTPTPNYSADLTVGTTYFIVVKLDAVQAPIQASLFINPVPGAAQPTTATVSNSAGTSAFATFASIFLRQAGNATAGTGNIQIDEIRVGTTWASVTPSGGCTSTNNLSVTNCGPYTLNAQTYATSGSYTQTLTNANAAGCDSIINLTLTVKNATTASISATACGTYTAPSGATFTTSGIKMDTITNVANCDSIITINLTMATSVTYYQDSDGDGFGNPAVSQAVCAQPTGYVTNANDCNDANAAIGLAQTFYRDFDNDGFGNALITQVACTQPTGYVSNNTDCKDSIASIYPGATEIPNNGIDENCNGSDSIIVAATLGQYQFTGNDCSAPLLGVTTQPTNATFSNYSAIGSSLVCAQANNVINYSGWNTSAVIDTTQYYSFTLVPDTCYGMNLTQLLFSHRISSGTGAIVNIRSSLDGFATNFHTISNITPGTLVNEVVSLPVAFNTVYTPITFRFYVTSMATSGATYRHDNVSVKGFINQLGTTTFYADADGDGFGNATTSIVNCVPPVGYVTNNTDCNDADSTEFPGATWVLDNDNDGFGATGSTVTSCYRRCYHVLPRC
jgi:hypothetical protein